MRRPWTVTSLSVFFGVGAATSATTLIALAVPGSFLEPMWRLNPRAREQFASMGFWAMVLMALVSASCLAASLGLWRGRRHGYVLGLALLTVSMLGDLANAVLGQEPRAWVGVPISALFLAVLATGRARAYFAPSDDRAGHSPSAP